LLIELSLPFLLLPVMAGSIRAEKRAACLEQPALPLTDLIGMHTVLTGQFVERLQALCGFQGQLKLELGTLSSSFLCHRVDPPLAGFMIPFFHLNQWSSFWGQLYVVSYQKRKQDEVQHPVMDQKVPLGLVPHVQARLLARHLRGDLEHYPPFLYR